MWILYFGMLSKNDSKKFASTSKLHFKIISQTLAPKLDSFEIRSGKILKNELLSLKYSNQYAEKHETIFNVVNGLKKSSL